MSPDPEGLEVFIRERMIPSPVASLPEISLYLAGPTSGLAQRFGDEATEPYWAFVWGGGLALARYLMDRPEGVAGKRVLDLGAGSGLVAIAAIKAGAASAQAVDIDPRAAVATRLNAGLNMVEVETATLNLLDGPPPDNIDTLLVGDLFYEAGLADRALAFLHRCRAAGLEVLIGDPGRKTLPVDALDQIGAAPVRDFGGGITGGGAGGGIYRLVSLHSEALSHSFLHSRRIHEMD